MAYPLKEIYRGYLFLNITYIIYILYLVFRIYTFYVLFIVYQRVSTQRNGACRHPTAAFRLSTFPLPPAWRPGRRTGSWTGLIAFGKLRFAMEKSPISRFFIGKPWKNQHVLICSFFIGTLWLFNIAMENDPFTDDFPIKPSIYNGFSIAMLNNQRVHQLDMAMSCSINETLPEGKPLVDEKPPRTANSGSMGC